MEPHARGSRSRWRQRVYVLLVFTFFLQVCFVYFDPLHAASAVPLSTRAQRGLSIWRANNCQVCHQIYGYGGFLGSDLTNVASRKPDEDFIEVLVNGRKQMPAFGLDEEQCEAIVAFLTEVDRTGTSIPQFTAVSEDANLDRLVPNYLEATQSEAPPAVIRGDALMRASRCAVCHVPLSGDLHGSADLTVIMSRASRDQARRAILKGAGTMPPFTSLTEDDANDMIEALIWMNRHRHDLGAFSSDKKKGTTFRWSAVPWFEYPNR